MNIHEYQAKEILRKYGVSVLNGKMVTTPQDAEAVAKELGGGLCVVKAQIHAGGRGKAGGVKLAKTPQDARQYAQDLLGTTLVTHQTGPEGKEVQKIFVEQGCAIAKEFYLGMVLDRATSRVTIMASSEGGVEIEEVAERAPEKILREAVDPAVGVGDFQGRKIAYGLGLPKEAVNKAVAFIRSLYRAVIETDASLVEINPLVLTQDNDLVALDAKMGFDDNALFRHADIRDMRDLAEENEKEVAASEFDLNYITLDGNIGCMVNGAGLAMATMDIIKHYGAEPANFLDIGGGATTEKVTEAFKIILSDKNVEGVLVNIFGGIMRCDVVANGVVEAAKQVNLSVPLVVRLEGTNVEQGKQILTDSGLNIIPASDLADGAKKAVEAVKAAAAQ